MPSSHENDSPSPSGRGPGGGVEQRKRLFRFAREMRQESTRAEQLLWYRLRGKRLNGLKFRRQIPMGPYIADFFCPSAELVIEVDRAIHVDRGADVRRDAWMQSRGLRVLRVWNDEVIGNIEGVLQAIAIAATPPPDPLPQGEGEK